MGAGGEGETRDTRAQRLTGIRRGMTRHGRRAARMLSFRARARQRGQTIVIFVMTFTVLIGILGLAVDSVRIYNQYAMMLRAAEAGALSGVIYMPNNYTTNLTINPFDNAVCRAYQEVAMSGIGPNCDPSSQPAVVASMASICSANAQATVEIAVCPVENSPYELEVYVTESINTVFLSALGLGPLTLTATAKAAYLPPSGVGVDPTGPGGTAGWGGIGINNGASCKTKGNPTPRCWGANINGPGELKEQGDPLVSCDEGLTSVLNPADTDASPDYGVSTNTYTGLPTNHPQSAYTSGLAPDVNPGSACTNSDLSLAFSGPSYYDPTTQTTGPLHQGYSYLVHVPQGDTEYLWVWNAPFAPTEGNNCNGNSTTNSQPYDVFFWNPASCKGGGKNATFYTYYPGSGCPDNSNPYSCYNANLYFNVTYTAYSLPNGVNDPNDVQLQYAYTASPYAGDNGVCQIGTNALPYSDNPGVLTTSVGSEDCTVTSKCVAQWCAIGSGLGDTATDPQFPTPGPLTGGSDANGTDYRITVVTSDFGTPSDFHLGWGAHDYSLALCESPTAGPTNGCTAFNGVTPSGATDSASIGGWGPSDYMLWFPGNTGVTEFPLAFVDKSYAGQILDVKMWDPGDLLGTNGKNTGTTLFAVAPPVPSGQDACSQGLTAGYPASSYTFVPSEERSGTVNSLPAVESSAAGDDIYNGLWAEERIQIPGDYGANGVSGPDPEGAWTICAQGSQTNDSDIAAFTVAALGSSPVHLK